MKQTLLLLFAVCIHLSLTAEVFKTIAGVSAGDLKNSLTTTELAEVTNLTISGTLDARDFVTLRDNMPVLAVLDLSATTITTYSGTEGTIGDDTIYPANELPQYAFSKDWAGKTTLKTIIFPSSITTIGDLAFYYCTGLVGELNLPSSLKTIGEYAFSDCSNLSGTLTLPSTMEIVKLSAFLNCEKLSELILPAGLVNINSAAFYYCSGLTSIKVLATTPIDLYYSGSVFEGVTHSTCTLYVPKDSRGSYLIADQWKEFLNITEMAATTLKNSTKNAINIYPNPTTDGFSVSGVTGIAQVTVHTLNGETVLNQEMSNADRISLNNFSAGCYIVSLIDASGITKHKLIKE